MLEELSVPRLAQRRSWQARTKPRSHDGRLLQTPERGAMPPPAHRPPKLLEFIPGVAARGRSGYVVVMTVRSPSICLPTPRENRWTQLARRLTLLWAVDEVRQGRMTRLRAAAVVGLGLDEFLHEASCHGLDAIDYDLDDFRRELADAP